MRDSGPQPDVTFRAAPVTRGGSGVLAFGLGVTLLGLSACMASGPETRRDAYLDCARDQGLRVEDGTIRTSSAADLERLNRCEALPR